MSRYLGWLANSILFVVVCFLMADTANAIFRALLTPPARAEVDVAAAPATTNRTWNERSVILERNLFDASLFAPAEATAQAGEVPEDLEATELPLDLLATIASNDPALAVAAILDRQTRQALVVHVNDEVKSQAKVLRIERKRIVLSENGAPRELAIEEEGEDGPPLVTRARAAARPRARAAESSRAQRAARALRNARAAKQRRAARETAGGSEEPEGGRPPAAALITDGRPEPHFDAGEMIGVQISGIRPGGVYAELGVVENDVITEVNGIPADEPQNISRILEQLSTAEERQVVVVRNGETITLPSAEE